MRVAIDIGYTGLVAILLHPVRSTVTILAVTAALTPYLIGIGISTGVQRDAKLSVEHGADLYVSANQFGRQSPVSLEAINAVAAVEGVQSVTPRIVGPIVLGRQRIRAVVVGVPSDRFPAEVQSIEGRLFQAGNVPELVIGHGLASELNLKVGDRVPPFYRSSRGDRVARVVGIFRGGLSLWESNLIFTSLETAGEIFDQPGMATELLVECRPGYEVIVQDRILRTVTLATGPQGNPQPAYVTAKHDLRAQLPVGLLHRGGIFNLHFVVVFVIGILVVLVTSGFGLAERHREIAILKALGWQTDEVLLRGGVECTLLSVVSASLAVIVAYVWLELLNGYWIAGAYLYGTGTSLRFEVPFELAPWPALLALIIAFVIIATGSVYSMWRAATVPPWKALRG